MEFVVFLTVLTVGVGVELIGLYLGWASLGIIAAIGCAAAFIVDALKKGGKDGQ